MGVQERLTTFLEDKKLEAKSFERICGLGNGTASKIGENARVTTYNRISKAFPELNMEWLKFGNGKMYIPISHNGIIKKDKGEVLMIPIVNLDARGGFGGNDVSDTAEYTDGYMPFSRDIARPEDIVVPVYGDSMSPKFPSGSFILIRNAPMWREYVELGAPHVLELVDYGRVLKNIQRSSNKDCFLLESINPKYEPTDIPKKLILHVFRVIMAVRRETL